MKKKHGKKGEASGGKQPNRIIRYFDRDEFAKALLLGYVRISTLDHVRQMESIRADPNEAVIKYEVENAYLDGNGRPNTEMQNLRALGVNIFSGASHIVLRNVTYRVSHPNAFVYSTSCIAKDPGLERTFGKYQVAISDPEEFARLVTIRLAKEYPTVSGVLFGHMAYNGRVFAGNQQPPHPAFISVSSLACEKEYRFFWTPRKKTLLSPFVLHVPEIIRLCSRIV